MGGLMSKLVKGAAREDWWKKIKPKAILSDEVVQNSEEMASELAARRATGDEAKVASGGLAVHPTPEDAPAPISDSDIEELLAGAKPQPSAPKTPAEIDVIKKKYDITPEKLKQMDKEDYVRRERKQQKLVGTDLRGKPSIKDVESIAGEGGDADLVKRGRELFPEYEGESDQTILSLMKQYMKQ